jgi:hypothetical protein
MAAIDSVDEANVEQEGQIRLISPIHPQPGANVLVSMALVGGGTAVSGLPLSEHTLTEVWLKADEDEAWAQIPAGDDTTKAPRNSFARSTEKGLQIAQKPCTHNV